MDRGGCEGPSELLGTPHVGEGHQHGRDSRTHIGAHDHRYRFVDPDHTAGHQAHDHRGRDRRGLDEDGRQETNEKATERIRHTLEQTIDQVLAEVLEATS